MRRSSLAHNEGMRRERVVSEAVESIGYEPATETLEVQFVGGAVYRYYAVPVAAYEALMTASSLGAHVNACIRDQYPTRLVSAPR